MKTISFTDDEKIMLFDQISSHFYNANFGRMSKADMELLMFHFYMERLIDEHRLEDGTVDYNLCSDYRISKEL